MDKPWRPDHRTLYKETLRKMLSKRSNSYLVLFAFVVASLAVGDRARGAGPPSNFVAVCGTGLCEYGKPFTVHGATAYGTYGQPATEVALAQRAKVNTLEIVEFETVHHDLGDAMSNATWSRVDTMIADARQAKLHVILNLSSYGQSLQVAGRQPTTTDWGAYLSFIAHRVNTVTGVPYKDDSTIAMVELFGEICFPGEVGDSCPAGTTGTASQMVSFFHRSETEWHSLAPNILVSSGGFSHLNGASSSGIPWQTIIADPADSVCDLEVNSENDVGKALGKFTVGCKSDAKPWFLSAWSSCYKDHGYPYYLTSDSAMAAHAQDMYKLAAGGSPAAYRAVGSDLWNLRDIGVAPGRCDLGPSYPQTFAAIQAAG